MKIKYTILFLFGFLFLYSSVEAQTVVQSIINTDQTWKASSGPYLVNGNVLVDSGVTVTVEPGTQIKGEGIVRIIVQGEFIAEGSASSVITVDSVDFEFAKDAVGYDFNTGNGSKFEYCVFNSRNNGGLKQIESKGPDLLISNCELNQCYYCVYGYQTSGSDSIRIRVDNTVYNGGGQGYVCYMSGNTYLELDEVSASSMGSMFLGNHATVTSCSFYDFKYYSGIRVSGSSYLLMDCNSFVKFSYYILDVSYVKANAHLEFTNNTLDSGGILVNIAGSAPLTAFTFEYNNLLHYSNNSVNCGAGGNPGSYNVLDMENNYWGTSDSNMINDGIEDYRDNILVPVYINHSNALSSENTDCSGGNIGAVPAFNMMGLNLYPNPADNLIRLDGVRGQSNVIIYNMQGVEVFNGNFEGSIEINTSDFTSGVYIIHLLSSEEGMARQTFVVKH